MTARYSRHAASFSIVLATFGLLAVAGAAHATTRNVASNGTDSPTCGSTSAPCRSISQAITLAVAGDTIVVGPGRYGDLNNNGIFGETGEEPGPGTCGCMIDVNKRLTIVSRNGAAATVIDAKGLAATAVLIEGPSASATVFGKANKGFTIAGGSGVVGLTINSGATSVVVTANISSYNDFGFRADASGAAFNNNRAVGSLFQGIFVSATTSIVGNVVTQGAQNGIWLSSGGPHTVKGNVSSGNLGDGIFVDAVVPGSLVTGNAILDNGGSGIEITAAGSATLNKNSIFGNGTTAGPTLNCGLTNAAAIPIDATKNFWGSGTGPGPDPADAVCGASAGTVTVVPVATKEVKVAVKGLK